MYLDYWQLEKRPFENTTDPAFYYPSECHQGALLKLRYGVESRRGAVLLAGGSGLGKSLLVQVLRRQLPETLGPVVHLIFPQLCTQELLAYLAAELGSGDPDGQLPATETSLRRVRQRLTENANEGKHALIVVDEAHLLEDHRTLESLRLLLNFETEHGFAATLLLVGQTKLLPALDRMPHFEERLGVKCLLRPFTIEETLSYVQHRLQTAGARREIIQPAALEIIHELSGGAPRRINRLCDLALLVGFAEERAHITPDHVAAVHGELVAVTPE
jgi:type II secretory pathway predicted ATPase ExeA